LNRPAQDGNYHQAAQNPGRPAVVK